jgi:hypothetical protein
VWSRGFLHGHVQRQRSLRPHARRRAVRAEPMHGREPRRRPVGLRSRGRCVRLGLRDTLRLRTLHVRARVRRVQHRLRHERAVRARQRMRRLAEDLRAVTRVRRLRRLRNGRSPRRTLVTDRSAPPPGRSPSTHVTGRVEQVICARARHERCS